MKFNEIARALGLEKYPKALDAVYENLSAITNAADKSGLNELQDKYSLLGDHYDIIMKTADELAKDELRFAFANTVAQYFKTCTVEEAQAVPMPKTNGTPEGDMMPLYILLSTVPAAIEEYVSRGFTVEETVKRLSYICRVLDSVKLRTGMFGIDAGFYEWLCVFVKARIFDCGIFNIEVTKFHDAVLILKNRSTDECVAVPMSGRYHRSGYVLGSAGFTDADGSFDADFKETDEAYIGYTTVCGLVKNERKTFEKSEWDCILRPGDGVILVHIPKGADLSQENIDSNVADAIRIANERYPEYAPRYAFTETWLISPEFIEMLGDKSRIVGFGNNFLRYPRKSSGKELFSYVFPGKDPDNYAELNEDTSLQRKVKQLYLDGGFIHVFSGVIV